MPHAGKDAKRVEQQMKAKAAGFKPAVKLTDEDYAKMEAAKKARKDQQEQMRKEKEKTEAQRKAVESKSGFDKLANELAKSGTLKPKSGFSTKLR